jgi:protein involved in polysaccharide export with SLBB domain
MSLGLEHPPGNGRRGSCLLRGAALALVLCAACQAPPLPVEQALPAPASAPVEVRRHLAFDDVVRVDVYGHPELSTGELGRRVDYEGNLDLPLLGPIPVVGLTVSAARDALQARADRFVKHATVAVTVVAYAPRFCYVMGEVQSAGAFELTQTTTALQSLALAGGLTRLADREEVVVLRTRGGELTVHAFNAQTPDAAGLFPIEPGDVVFARESGSGTFQQQILPYLQGLAQPFSATVSLFLVANRK